MRTLNRIMLAGAAALAFGSAASAADLIIEEPIVGVVDAGGDWEGMYVGAFVGGAAGVADHDNAVAPSPCAVPPLDGCDVDISGFLVGVTAGANFNVSDGIVAGIAGDIAWSDVSGSDNFGIIVGDSSNSINWQGSLRGVLGFDAGAFMPYLTAGLAVANASHYSDFAGITADATHIGWTAGVGVAIAATENIVIDLQYRYSDFGSQEYNMGFAPFNPSFGLTQHAVTAGVNFRF